MARLFRPRSTEIIDRSSRPRAACVPPVRDQGLDGLRRRLLHDRTEGAAAGRLGNRREPEEVGASKARRRPATARNCPGTTRPRPSDGYQTAYVPGICLFAEMVHFSRAIRWFVPSFHYFVKQLFSGRCTPWRRVGGSWRQQVKKKSSTRLTTPSTTSLSPQLLTMRKQSRLQPSNSSPRTKNHPGR